MKVGKGYTYNIHRHIHTYIYLVGIPVYVCISRHTYVGLYIDFAK